MLTDRFTTEYAGLAGRVCIDFEPTEHVYGIGPTPESLSAAPSASDIVEFLPKFLASWGQNCGIDGVLSLLDRATTRRMADGEILVDSSRIPTDDPKYVLAEIKKLRKDHDSVRDAAADRGAAVHAAFRGFVVNGVMPNPHDYSAGDLKGYIASLALLCEALKGRFESIVCEEPICSPSLGVAGTPDLYADLKPTRVQVGGNIGPNKRPKFDDKSGRVLIDLKTSAQVYMSHTWQVSAYQMMLEECGFEVPQTRAVVLIKPMGAGYNWKEQPSRVDAFSHLVKVWEAENRPEGWEWS